MATFIPWNAKKLRLYSGQKLHIEADSKVLFVTDETDPDPVSPHPLDLDRLKRMGVSPSEAINDVMPLIQSGEILQPDAYDMFYWAMYR